MVSIENNAELICSVKTIDVVGSIDNVDLLEIYDDVGSIRIEFKIVMSVSKFETVCAVESDTTDGIFDNEAVASVDDK